VNNEQILLLNCKGGDGGNGGRGEDGQQGGEGAKGRNATKYRDAEVCPVSLFPRIYMTEETRTVSQVPEGESEFTVRYSMSCQLISNSGGYGTDGASGGKSGNIFIELDEADMDLMLPVFWDIRGGKGGGSGTHGEPGDGGIGGQGGDGIVW
jgi:hypothetical protein